MRLFVLLSMFPALALAAPLDVQVTTDGWVEGETEVAVSPEVALRFLSDPRNVVAAEGRGTTMTVNPNGRCAQVLAVVPTPLGDMTYESRRCALNDGYRATLVRSEDFLAYEQEWTIVETPTGVRLRCAVKHQLSIPLPASFREAFTRRAVQRLLRTVGPAIAASDAKPEGSLASR